MGFQNHLMICVWIALVGFLVPSSTTATNSNSTTRQRNQVCPLYQQTGSLQGEVRLSTQPPVANFNYQSTLGNCWCLPATGSVALYQYFFPRTTIATYALYTITLGDAGTTESGFNGILCYVYDHRTTGTVPIYQFYNSKTTNRWYSTSYTPPNGDFVLEKVAFYTLQQ